MLTVYKASAGSGKTYELAYQYIKLLLGKRLADGSYILNNKGKNADRRPHAKILAITFTNKATAEMKGRILKELDALTRMPAPGANDAPYAGKLMKEFGCSRSDLRDMAEWALRTLLNDYSAFNVSTIDSFFQTILRSFAREIDRQGDYRLELDTDTALAQAMAMLFDEVNFNPDSEGAKLISIWLEEVARERMLDGSDFNPFNRSSSLYSTIVGRLKGIFNEDFTSREAEMAKYLSDPSRLRKFDQWISDESKRLLKLQINETEKLRKCGYHFQRNYINNLLDKIIEAGEVNSELYKPISEKRGYIQAIESRDADAIFGKKYKASEEDVDAVVSWLETIEQTYALRSIYSVIHHSIHSLWSLIYIYNYIDRYRAENNLILISDTNSLLKTIIDGSDAPFIYERVGVMLENFLIDEFQDTSRMQWENLKPLVANSITAADSLIIGDEKQSIYRWRGGDSDLLAHSVSEKDFPVSSFVRGNRPGENTNHRSAHDIVRFNNTLFHRLSKKDGGEYYDGYAAVAQSLFENTAELSSHICFNNLSKQGWFETAVSVLKRINPDFPEDTLTSARQAALTIMAETILSQLNRGYKQSDIAILCRQKEDGTEVAEFISKNYPGKIRLISEESLLLKNSNSIKLIVSVLEIIDKSLNDHSLEGSSHQESARATIAQSSLFINEREKEIAARNYEVRRRRAALSDKFEYYVAAGHELSDALQLAVTDASNLETASDSTIATDQNLGDDLVKLRELAPVNISALVQAIIELKIHPDNRKRELPYIIAFVDMVDEFMQNYNPSVHSFLSYWRDNQDTLAIVPGASENAVTISTVHKAKGLEWPCVHIPLMNWYFERGPRDGWFDTSDILCPDGVTPPPIMFLQTTPFFGNAGSPFKREYDIRSYWEKFDNLNVAYVAFTRAERELHVSFLGGKEDDTSMASSMREALAAAPWPDESGSPLYMDFAPYLLPDGSFELGRPTTPSAKKPKTSEIEIMPAPKFVVSFNSMNKRFVRLSDLTTSETSDLDEADLGNEQIREIVDAPGNDVLRRAAHKGLVMHSILSAMETIEDFDSAVEKNRKKVSSEEMYQYASELRNAFAEGGETVARWFSPDNIRALTEQSIYHKTSDEITRADRIVWLPDGSIEVIDYKFTLGEAPSHRSQVMAYAADIESVAGVPVRAYLWYPLKNKIIEIKGS